MSMVSNSNNCGVDSDFIRATTTGKDVEIFDTSEQLVPEKDTSQS